MRVTTLPFFFSRFRLKLSRLIRPTEPFRIHWSSAAPKPRAAPLFQLVMVPRLLSWPCMWSIGFRKPRHS